MPRKARRTLVEALGAIPDPRRQCGNLRHNLADVLVMSLCGVLCGCDDFTEIEWFCHHRESFFREFLDLPHGIPSHDTFRRVLSAVSPAALCQCLTAWLQSNAEVESPPRENGPTVIAIDGKTMRRTGDRRRALGPLHVVSAWASERGLTLGQVAVDGKSNEITAIPVLLDLLDLRGAVVTIDAAGCQKDIARKIVDKGGDYMLALKGNQPTLQQAVIEHFVNQEEAASPDRSLRRHRTTERNHGRIEQRDVTVVAAPADLPGRDEWAALTSLVSVVRETTDPITGETTGEVRYFLSSLPPKVRTAARVVRSHWGVETSLHWVLDVVFKEDSNRTRNRNAAQNLAALNRLAVAVLRADTSLKASVKNKRKSAGWNQQYLRHLLRLKL